MTDLLYLAGTVAFFAIMLGYVAFCDRLGRGHGATESGHESR